MGLLAELERRTRRVDIFEDRARAEVDLVLAAIFAAGVAAAQAEVAVLDAIDARTWADERAAAPGTG